MKCQDEGHIQMAVRLVKAEAVLSVLALRGVITRNPADEMCCGMSRDTDGFCQHRPGHPVYVPATAPQSVAEEK